jgi:hypothetical protein
MISIQLLGLGLAKQPFTLIVYLLKQNGVLFACLLHCRPSEGALPPPPAVGVAIKDEGKAGSGSDEEHHRKHAKKEHKKKSKCVGSVYSTVYVFYA